MEKINKYLAHTKTVLKHKRIVFSLMRKCGYGWRGFWHDMSKFSPTEFISSAKYFQGNKSPIEKEKEEIGYSNAWLHHKGHNKHHWEYWTDFGKDGEVIAYKMPWKYVVEMVCDYVAAGKTYSKEKWTQHEPLGYHTKMKSQRHYHKDTLWLLETFLEIIDIYGLERFIRTVKNKGYLYEEYLERHIP